MRSRPTCGSPARQNFILANVPTDRVPDAVARPQEGRVLARAQHGPRAEGCGLYGRAALQLLGNRDEDATRRPHRRARSAFWARDRRTSDYSSTAARMLARNTGSPTSAFRERRFATPRASVSRPTTSSSAAGSDPTQRSANRCLGVYRRAELTDAVGGLVEGWIRQREGEEAFSSFARRLDDEELGALAGLEPAKTRSRKDNA